MPYPVVLAWFGHILEKVGIASGPFERAGVSWTVRREEFVKSLTWPLAAFCFVMLLSVNYWVWPVTYLLFKSFLYMPSGWLIWGIGFVSVAVFIWGLASFFRRTSKLAPHMKEARRCLDLGDLEGHAQVKSELKRMGAGTRFNPLFVGLIAIQFLVPVTIALTYWSGMQSPITARWDKGKIRLTTPREQLQARLKLIEASGLFTPLSR